MSNNEPLWKVMNNAAMQAQKSGRDGRLSYAAEILAIAKEIQLRWDNDLPDDSDLPGAIGMEIYHWLLAEADRAEAGR
jgi:hypothetical protein